MGNYENLKQSITEVIRTNGNKEITGAVLQSTLLTIISTVGANATFSGIATPTTNPGTPDGPVFWLASESGTYSNFGGVELQDGLSVLMWNGSWSSQQIFRIDNVPTAGSDNLVKSGGVSVQIGMNMKSGEGLLNGCWMPTDGVWRQDYQNYKSTPKYQCLGKKPYIEGANWVLMPIWDLNGDYIGQSPTENTDWSTVGWFAYCFRISENPDGFSNLTIQTAIKQDVIELREADALLSQRINEQNDKIYSINANAGMYLIGSNELLEGYWRSDNGGYKENAQYRTTPKMKCCGNKPVLNGAVSAYACGWNKNGVFLGIENAYDSLNWTEVWEFAFIFAVSANPDGFDNLIISSEFRNDINETKEKIGYIVKGASTLLTGVWLPADGTWSTNIPDYKSTPKYDCYGEKPYITGANWILMPIWDKRGNYIGQSPDDNTNWSEVGQYAYCFRISENPDGFDNLVIATTAEGKLLDHEARINTLEGETSDIYNQLTERPIPYKDIICCDGDSLTWGDLGTNYIGDQATHNFPKVLQQSLGERYLVLNCGIPGIQSTTVLGNATGYRVREAFTIPATKNTPVSFKCSMFRSIDGIKEVYAFGPWISHKVTAMMNPAYIGNVKVRILQQTESGWDERCRVERYEDGEAVNVAIGDTMLTNEVLFKDKVTHIIFMGQNGGWVKQNETIHDTASINELVGQYNDLIRTSKELYICISSHKWNGVSGTGAWEGESVFETAFGSHYINLRRYMAEDGIADAISKGYLPDDGTYPTAADTEAMTNGQCPPSLLHDVEGDRIHFTDVGYHLLGDLVYQKYMELYKKSVLGTLNS